MDAAPAHVDRLDLVGRRGADRLVIAFADQIVVLDDAAQRRQREQMRHHRRAVLEANVEHQPVAVDRQMQRVRAAVVADRREGVLLEQIVDRDRALVLDVRIGAADRSFVEGDGDQPPACRQRALFSPGSSLIEADRHRAGVRGKSLRFAERDRCGAERAQLLGSAFEHRSALHEIEHAETRREARRARRRQHVVGAGDVIADRFGRVRADEDRAGIAHFGKRLGIVGDDLQMLGRDPVGQRDGVGQLRHQDDGAEIAPLRAGDLARGSVVSCASTAFSTRSASSASSVIRIDCAAVSCSACAKQIGGDPVGIAGRSAMISTSEGPAIMSMPTWPNTRRLAAAT